MTMVYPPKADADVPTARSVYIAGPMRGLPRYNFDAFLDAERRLTPYFKVTSPATHDINSGFDPDRTMEEQDFDLPTALVWDLQQVATVDAIVLLPGWAYSTGVAAELALASALGKTVYTYHPLGDGDLYELHALGTRNDQPTSEVRVVNEKTGGAKGSKPARFDLIPKGPLWKVAELYGKGAEKYADRNWQRGYNWSLSFAALNRHLWLFWGGEDNDLETRCHHLASVIFHAMAMMEFGDTHPELDDRPH